jgi:hypothetical protein
MPRTCARPGRRARPTPGKLAVDIELRIHPLHHAAALARRENLDRRARRPDHLAGQAPHPAEALTDLGPGQGDGSASRITMATNMQVYFCDPHSPWQQTDLSVDGPDDLAAVAAELNARPAKPSTGKHQPSSPIKHSHKPTNHRVRGYAATPRRRRWSRCASGEPAPGPARRLLAADR